MRVHLEGSISFPTPPAFSGSGLIEGGDEGSGVFVAGSGRLNFQFDSSQGQRRRSAMTSAEPEATVHPTFLYLSAFSSPKIFL